ALDATPLTLTSAAVFVPSIGGSPEGTLIAGETATYSASFVVNVAAVVGGGMSNSVTVSGDPALGPPFVVTDISDDGDDGDGNLVDDPTVYPLVPSLVTSGLSVTKTTPVGVVERGSVVPYTISIANNTAVSVGLLTLVDVLPSGFLYVDGSATLAAVPFAVTVAGKVVTWPSISVAPFATLTATLSARITTGAQAGEHVNTASVRDPATGALLAPQATAVVRILPEPVFDCGDVIGKVFNDQNRDGYQNQGEAGIPAARVAGVDGTIITTDPFGRYHVPCAMLPQDRGSNFILKLDTRSLPAGYRVTTENPRVMRLTPGKMTEMNFGAAITRVVRVDLNGRAFVVGADGRAALSPALVAGIATLLPQIAAQPVNLRLAYHVPRKATSDDLRRGRALSRLVERHIERAWRDIGQVMLTIELTIVREEE
ncbi:MAG: putative repeat protein (TIGR01451 family), partial [Paracoccaceae bacterium]